MSRRYFVLLPALCFVICGCLSDDSDPFGRSQKTAIPPREKLPKGSLEAASRVDAVGRQIVKANPEITDSLLFLSIGAPEVSAFHRGTTEIYVSDGLVQRCKTDGELAAVLCNELGKMMVEAQAQGKVKPPPERERPYTLTFDREGDPDRTQLAEQAVYERQNPRRPTSASSPEQDPAMLARGYLTKAGFAADDLSKAATLIRQAESNPAFNQMVSPRAESLAIPKRR